MLRAQQAAIQFRGSIGAADYTISLANELQDNSIETKIEQINQTNLKNENLPEILVSNVSFSFGENQVISDISFKIMPGKFCALVGLSGAGKSTLVDLILGIHKPESGQILIHGLPPANLVREYSNFISYVPQENNLINGTIVENLNFSYSNQQYSIDECLRTLELVGLVEWVDSLPLGLDTQIGETGVKLSGGQRQRLSIAAALLCNPKLLILDEATSALDAISEDEIKSLLDGIKGQVTCLVIAHRLSSIRDADSIFMIENGSLAGQGRFEELKKINSTFAKQAKLMGL
jgi:ABC-type multidrug transport system fused ATPase/permease subunit